MMFLDKDSYHYDNNPEYLYDNDLFNDTSYVLNKEVLLKSTLRVLENTHARIPTTSFDDYSAWGGNIEFGKAALDASYNRKSSKSEIMLPLTDEEINRLEDNLAQNVTSLIEEHPETTFYLFFPPYSIYYWDAEVQGGTLLQSLGLEKRAIEILLEYENVRLFGFLDEFELITDLNYYMDMWHYSGEINSRMLQWMHSGEHELTKENYQDYCTRVWEFYSTYNYDALFTDDA